MRGARTDDPRAARSGEPRFLRAAARRLLLGVTRREPTRENGGGRREGRGGEGGGPRGGGPRILPPGTLSPHAGSSPPPLGPGCTQAGGVPGEALRVPSRSPRPGRNGMARGAGFWTSGSANQKELLIRVVVFQRRPGGGCSLRPLHPPTPNPPGEARRAESESLGGVPGRPGFRGARQGPPLSYSGVAVAGALQPSPRQGVHGRAGSQQRGKGLERGSLSLSLSFSVWKMGAVASKDYLLI